MTTAAADAPTVTPAALAALLGDDRVLIAARKLIDAKLRRQALYAVPNEDTSSNGQPHTRAVFLANSDAREALEDLTDAVERAAERLAQEKTR